MRDDQGKVIGCQTRTINGIFPPDSKSHGIREATRWIQNFQANKFVIETNAKAVHDAFYSEIEDHSELGMILADCRSLHSILPFTISQVRKQTNRAADSLTKLCWEK